MDQEKPDRAEEGRSVWRCLFYMLEPFLPDDSRHSDGWTASIIYVIALVISGLLLGLIPLIQKDPEAASITSGHVDGFLITCMLPAMLWIISVLCRQNDRGVVDFGGVSLPYHDALLRVAYACGSFSFLGSIVHVYNVSRCSLPMTRLASAVVESILLMAQLLFIKRFAKAAFHRTPTLRLILFHLLGTNLCLWLNSVFSAIQSLESRSDEPGNAHPSAAEALDSPSATCWAYPSSDHGFSARLILAERYYYYFYMQYLLCSVFILYIIWSRMRSLDNFPQDIYIYDELMDMENGWSPPQSADLHSKIRAAVGRFPPSSPEQHERLEMIEVPANTRGFRNGISVIIQPSFLLGAFTALSAFGLVLWVVQIEWKDAYAPYYTFLDGCLQAIMSVGYWLGSRDLSNQKSSATMPSSVSTLFLFSFSMTLFFNVLSLSASLLEGRLMYPISSYLGIRQALSILSVMQQTGYVMFALRRTQDMSLRGGCRLFGPISLVMASANMILWIQNVFLDARVSSIASVQVQLFGETSWYKVMYLCDPFQLYYRIQSASFLLEIYRAHKGSSNS